MLGEEGTDFSVEWIIGMLNRRKWLALTVFLCFSVAGISIVTWLPDIYLSSTTVLIENQQIPNQLVRSTVTGTVDTRLQAIRQEILSRSRLKELIARYGLYPEAREIVPMELLVGKMRRAIQVDLTQRGSRRLPTVAFTITYRGETPDTVAAVTNTLAALFVEENRKVREAQATGTSEFLSAQLEEMRSSLEQQERRLSTFKKSHIGELPHQQEANLKTLESLNLELQQNLVSQAQASERRASLAKHMAEAQGFVTDGPDATMAQYTRMKQELAQLRTTYTEKHPDVVRLKNEIAKLESRRHGVGGTKNPQSDDAPDNPYVAELTKVMDEEDRQLSALTAEAERLRESIETYRQRVEIAPRVEQQYQLLSRDYETTTELYRSLLGRQQEAALAENMERREKGEQFRVIEPAIAADRPAAPNRPQLHMIAILLSLGLAAGAALLAEQLDSSFHSVDELRRFTDRRLIGSIPQIVTSADRTRWKWKFVLGAFSLALGLAAIATGAYLFAEGNVALTSRLLF